MSIIYTKDPEPDRCINLRPQTDHHGYPITVRCMKKAYPVHVCVFPAQVQLQANTSSLNYNKEVA